MYRIIIADDEEIECRALEMMIRNEFPDMEILPYVQNGIDLVASVKKIIRISRSLTSICRDSMAWMRLK